MMKTAIFYFQLEDDSYPDKDLKDILRCAYKLSKKTSANVVLVETPAIESIEKTTVLQGLLAGLILRTGSTYKNPAGVETTINIFAPKTLPLPLSHFKHCQRRVDILRPLLKSGFEILTNCSDVEALKKDVSDMKVVTIAEVSK